MDITLSTLLLLVVSFLVAGMVKGVTGMGLPTVAMALLSAFMPPASAAALLLIPSLVTNIWQIWAGSHLIALLSRLWGMLLGILIGTLIGSPLLVHINPQWSGLALGFALLIYANYALLSPNWCIPKVQEKWLSPLIGLLTGLITGATGVFVMPAVPYLQALRLGKDELVQALGLSFTVSTLALGSGLIAHQSLPLTQLHTSLIALVPALAGMFWGQKIRLLISPSRFRQVFLIILSLLGLELIARPFLSLLW